MVMMMRMGENGRHAQLGGKTIISNTKGEELTGEWGCVRRAHYYDEEGDLVGDDGGDGDAADDGNGYLGAGRATSGVVLTNTGAGFLGSGGVAV